MRNSIAVGAALSICIAGGAAALARQLDLPSPPPDPRLSATGPDVPGPRPSHPPSGPPEATADTFMAQSQLLVSRRLAELEERCERLRAELSAAEAERVKWQAISEAMASVPERFGQLTATPAPHPTGASSPFELPPAPPPSEPSLELPPDNPFQPAPSGGGFRLPSIE